MPSKFVSNAAERAGVSLETAEHRWAEAKKAVKKGKRRGSWYWGKVMNTFKRMMGLMEGVTFSEFLLVEEAQPMPKNIKLAGPYVAVKDEDSERRISYQIKKMLSDDEVQLRISVWFGRSDDNTGGSWTFRPTEMLSDRLRAEINREKEYMSPLSVRDAKALQAWARSHMQYLINRNIVDEVTVPAKDE